MRAILVLLVCSVASLCNAASVDFIKKCKIDDYKCQKESTQAALPYFVAGIPELGIEPLDPLHYDYVDASPNGIKLILRDSIVTGARTCVLKKLQVKNSQLHFKALCDLELNSQYDMNGMLLTFPIEGNGKAYGALNKILLTVDADLVEKTRKDGKVHWDITTWKHSYELQDKAVVRFDNLFHGNEALARTVDDLIKANPNEVVGQIGQPMIKEIVAKIIKIADKFFRTVPLEELVEY